MSDIGREELQKAREVRLQQAHERRAAQASERHLHGMLLDQHWVQVIINWKEEGLYPGRRKGGGGIDTSHRPVHVDAPLV